MRSLTCAAFLAACIATRPAMADSNATSTGIVFLSMAGSVVLVSGTAEALSSDETARAATRVLEQAGRMVVLSVRTGAEIATVILRDAATAAVVSLTLPARVLAAGSPYQGAEVRALRTGAGLLLECDGRFLTFVPYPESRHLVRSHAVLR